MVLRIGSELSLESLFFIPRLHFSSIMRYNRINVPIVVSVFDLLLDVVKGLLHIFNLRFDNNHL